MLLVLVVSVSSVLHVETRASRSLRDLHMARQNALLGLEIALGQLQEYAGKDQAVTFPATTYYPTKNTSNGTGPLYDDPTFGYRSLADVSQTRTFVTPAERRLWEQRLAQWWSSRNPRWVGVVDSSLRRDPQISANQFGEFKRDQLPVWLVSGNEKFRFDFGNSTSYPPGYQTPDQQLPEPADPNNAAASQDARVVVALVGNGSATRAAESVDGLDGRVLARKQPVTGTANRTLGHYAYWVADESTKANFAVRDPFEGAGGPGTEEYRHRLQVPQRIGWEMVGGFANATFGANDVRLGRISTTREISLLETNTLRAPEIYQAGRRNFHSLTAFSRSLLTDTALGGLKKDLTPLLHGNASGYNLNASIANPIRYSSNDPRLDVTQGGFPASTQNLPTWGELRTWAQTSAGGGAVTPAPGRAPVLTSYRLFFSLTHKDGALRMHFIPCFTLWNPLDVRLANAEYTLRFRHNFQLWRFGVATAGITDPTPANSNDGQYWPNGNATASPTTFYLHQLEPLGWYDRRNPRFKVFGMGGNDESFINNANTLNPPVFNGNPRYRIAPFDNFPSGNPIASPPLPFGGNATLIPYRFQASFAPGEVKVFTIPNHQFFSDPSELHTGSTAVLLANDYDPDYPGSFYFEFARFRDVDGNGTTIPQPDSNTRFYAELLIPSAGSTNTPMFNSAILLSGATELWRAQNFGIHPNWGANLNLAWTSAHIQPAQPQNWRKVYNFDDWVEMPKSGSTGSALAPLVAMYRAHLEPFPVPAWRIFTWQNRLFHDGPNKFQRGFANFNLSAPVFELPLEIEGARAADAANNQDLYTTMAIFETVHDATANLSTFMRWDDNQATSSASGAEGFALLTTRFQDSLGNKGLSRLPLRQYSRPDSDVLSLGRLQQANLSRFAWQPTFPIGNSEASPYVDRARISGLVSYSIGNATNVQHIAVPQWMRPRGIRHNTAENRLIDLSYILNENLWDSYFLSSIPQSGAISMDNTNPLPNSRHRFTAGHGLSLTELRDPFLAAAALENLGALNVNSASVEAWKGLLSAFRRLEFFNNDSRTPAEKNSSIPISRSLDPQGGPLRFTFADQDAGDVGANPFSNRDYSKFFTGFRYLTDEMIEALAQRIVDEVRLRGPFYSLSDFVNRRLVAPQGVNNPQSVWRQTRERNRSTDITSAIHSYGVPSNFYGGSYNDQILTGYDPFPGLAGLNGALQRAIHLSGINGGLNFPSSLPLDNRSFRVDVNPRHLSPNPENRGNQPMQIHPHAGHYLDTEHLAGAPTGEVGQLLSHSPGFVTQGDILAMIGPALTPRGDTFLVRSYGDATDRSGRVVSRAWLEAVVQRVAEPVAAAGMSGLLKWQPANSFGRKFRVVSIRWLSPEEV